MECKPREEIVGKRFLCTRSSAEQNIDGISEWEWRSGIVRAITHRDIGDEDISVR